MLSYDRQNVLDLSQKNHTYTDFINKDLIHFSNYDNERSIPNLCDGMKISHRKIMYCSFKRNLRNEIRVAQLAGYVSENGAYHHGEASLNGAIVTLAQNYIGSNNINLLEPSGQFVSRIQGCKDSAQPRYIHTKLTDLSNLIYNKLDTPLLNNQYDDELPIEPEYYMPIIPMVLVNGTEGIGTGWSSGVPKFNPIDLINNIRAKFNKEAIEPLQPYYRGFRGSIVKYGKNQWLSRGNYSLEGTNIIEVTELPVGVWTQNFHNNLEELMVSPGGKKSNNKGKKKVNIKDIDKKPIIKDYTNYSTESKVHYKIKFEIEYLNDMLSETDKNGITKLESTLKLVSKISCDKKLVLYDEKCKLKKFNSIEDIFEHYYKVRYSFYEKRKDNLLNDLKNNLNLINVKIRFIKDIINKI